MIIEKENYEEERKKLKDQEDFVFGLPRWLILSEKLTANDKLFCMLLIHHRNPHTKLCYPSIPLLSSEAHFSRKTVKRIRKKLSKLGLISYQKGTGQKHHAKYKLKWLDSSKGEITKIKRILRIKKVGTKFTHLSRDKSSPVSRDKSSPVSRDKSSPLLSKKNAPTISNKATLPHKNKEGNNKESNNKTIKQQEEETKVSSAAVNSSFSIKPETQKKLREWHISNGNIRELILQVMKFSDNIDEYFQDWIAFIKENPKIKNPAGFLIKMVEEKSEPHKEKLSYAQNQINLREAKIDLEKSCTANRIYEWLKKINPKYHSELQKHLKRIYPEGKAYFEAEIRYDREKVR